MTVSVHVNYYQRTVVARNPDGGAQYRYDPIHDGSPGVLTGEVVPAPGDRVWLGAACYQVLGRWWQYPTQGSPAWPTGATAPDSLMCNLLVEPADGLFMDEPDQQHDA